ncbi:MAG TPA: ATP-binding protein [Solirubrobacteraceae bacterium]
MNDALDQQTQQAVTMLPATLLLKLKRDLQAPSVARAAATGRCRGLDLSDSLCDTLVLLVSEVVTNAVRHSNAPHDTPIILTTSVTEDSIRVTVIDTGDGFTPMPREPSAAQGGYGLYLVDKAARRWGVDRVGGTRVWFELDRS